MASEIKNKLTDRLLGARWPRGNGSSIVEKSKNIENNNDNDLKWRK